MFQSIRDLWHKWFNADQFEGLLNQSPVPGVTLLAVIWAVCALLLTLSVSRQREMHWRVGERSPITLTARCDFEYEDLRATEEKRVEARKKSTLFFKVDPVRSKKLNDTLKDFFTAVIERNAGKEVDPSTPGKIAARDASAALIQYVAPRSGDFKDRANRALNRGILSDALRAKYGNPDRAVKIEDLHGNTNHYELTLADCRDLNAVLKEIFFVDDKMLLCNEFCDKVSKILDKTGTLVPDEAKTAAAEKAAAGVAPVMRKVAKNDPLVDKGTIITEALKVKLDAERRHLPRNFEHNLLIINLGGSLALMAIVVIYLAILRPQFFRQPRDMAVASLVVASSLWINYLAIIYFDEWKLPSSQLIVCVVPVILPMVLLAVTLGLRTAFCCGFLTATVTTLMIANDAQFQLSLAVRWLLTGGISALVVCHVVSYRSFFMRTFLASVVLNALFNGDVLYQMNLGVAELKQITIVIFVMSFGCAILALVMIFALELVFNLDTNMALTILANLNHPLLERLKREAPGTMFHSITVGTLAEDAATAIGASALRAKVGALFHDIGKLAMPQYFTENNHNGNKHQFLAPSLSSNIIRNHVKEGLVLARKYRLFRYIRDAIATHHGDDLTAYFYQLALRKQREAGEPESSVSESEYRYDGLPPDLKELAIISLADACEAASRSLKNPSEPRIREIVDDIISKRLLGGQLRRAQLTLAELATIRNCFIKTLININHGRIAYNFEEKDEPSCDGVESAPAAETGK